MKEKGLRRDLNPPQAVSVFILRGIKSTAAYTNQAILRRPRNLKNFNQLLIYNCFRDISLKVC